MEIVIILCIVSAYLMIRSIVRRVQRTQESDDGVFDDIDTSLTETEERIAALPKQEDDL
jgi:hypothetical protein